MRYATELRTTNCQKRFTQGYIFIENKESSWSQSVVRLFPVITMFWFIFPNFLIQVHCSFDYLYSDKEWVSPSQQLPFQDFKPSSKYESSNSNTRYTNAEYPNTAYTETIYSNLVDPTLSLYDYNILADNFLDTEDLLATNSDIEGAEQRRKYVRDWLGALYFQKRLTAKWRTLLEMSLLLLVVLPRSLPPLHWSWVSG